MSSAQGARPHPTEEELSSVLGHYENGRFLQAYHASQTIGPLESWCGTPGRLMSGRLARHCGASALATRQLLRAWRHDPSDWRARYYFAWTLTDFRGAVAAWDKLNEFGLPPTEDRRLWTDFMILRGRTAAILRDFETADRWFAEAEQTGHETLWLAVERCHRLTWADRTEEALEVARTGLKTAPNHWALTGEAARCLQSLGRDEESLALLREASGRLESAYLCQTLHALEVELELHRDALHTLERMEALCPLADQSFKEWIAASRSTCHYHLGDHAAAALHAKDAGNADWWGAFRGRLENADARLKRNVLPVGFVRQNEKTCVPATLTILSRYWGHPADHLEVAEAICYDGTPSHSERRWAENNGWITREFTVTLAAARALIDRGIPFALTTQAPGHGHEQVVMGYDEIRASLLIRDPGFRNRREALADALFENQKASGPRGMVMVRADRADLLEALDLPDAALYDLHHVLLTALDRHDRPAAVEALNRAVEVDPNHRLTHQSARALAAYDRDTPKLLDSLERLLKLFPDDVGLELGRLSCLRDLARREDRLQMLRDRASSRTSDSLIFQELAAELALDGRERAQASKLLRRASRTRPHDPSAVGLRAQIEWAEGRFEEALALQRIAACLDDKREDLACAYFRACRHLNRTQEALSFLQRRFELNAKQSSLPGRTLVWAYDELERSAEALTIIEAALAKRPNDGELKLFAAEHLFGHGQFLRADDLLKQARTQTRETVWRRTAAVLTEWKGATDHALEHWQAVLLEEPMAMDAHQAFARLKRSLAGRSAAFDAVNAAHERFPFFVPLHHLLAELARDEGAEKSVAVAEELVEANPADAWAQRELAVRLSLLGRHTEAVVHAGMAVEIDPAASSSHWVAGSVLAASGNRSEARESFWKAIQKSADNTQAMRGLLENAATLDERKHDVIRIQTELYRQTIFGEGLLEFPDIARPFLEVVELLKIMQDAHRARPDLWQAWSGLSAQLVASGRSDQGLEIAREATTRFPLVPRVWLDLAMVHRARLERPEETAALEKVRELNAGWGWAMRELAFTHESAGSIARAREVLEATRRRAPSDPFTLGALGLILWKEGDRQRGFDLVREAALLEPGYDWAWARLSEWGPFVGKPAATAEFAEELTTRRPGEARSWFMYARVLEGSDRLEDALKAIDHALALNPRMADGWSFKAYLLTKAGRWHAAAASCRPEIFGDQPPAELGARAAWISSQRNDLDSAIEQMQAVLRDDPSLVWGWRCLIDWLSAKERTQDALEAVEVLCRLSPNDAVTLGYSADLKLRLKLNRRDEAKSELQRAFKLDPNYQWAGDSLFHLQLEDKEFSEAVDTLNSLRRLMRGPSACERELRLMAALGNRGEIRRVLRELCESPDDEPDAFERIADFLSKQGFLEEGISVASQIMATENSNPEVAAFWVTLTRAQGRFNNWRELENLGARSEKATRGFLKQLEVAADELHLLKQGREMFGVDRWAWRFRRVLKRHQAWFRSDTRLWGKVSYVLTVRGPEKRVIEWMEDWRTRPDAEPWMFANMVTCLHRLGRDSEAKDAVRHVLGRLQRDGSSIRFELYEAVYSAVEGNDDIGRKLAASLKNAALPEYETILRRFLGLVTGSSLSLPDSNEIDPVHKQTIRAFLRSHASSKTMRRACAVLTKRLAARHSRPWFGWWCRWQLWTRAALGQ